MYGKEASNQKQGIDRQHHTSPNQRNQRTKDKHYAHSHECRLRRNPPTPTFHLAYIVLLTGRLKINLP